MKAFGVIRTWQVDWHWALLGVIFLALCGCQSQSVRPTAKVPESGGFRSPYHLEQEESEVKFGTGGPGTPVPRAGWEGLLEVGKNYCEGVDGKVCMRTISKVEDFSRLSIWTDGLAGSSEAVRFIIDNRNEDLQVYFFDARQYRFHFNFARSVLRNEETLFDFNHSTYFVPDKRFIAGNLRRYSLTQSNVPEETYAVEFYPQDQIREEQIQNAILAVQQVLKIPGVSLAFVANSSHQTVQKASVQNALRSAKVRILPIHELIAGTPIRGLYQGEAYGIFRSEFRVEELGPADIPVLFQAVSHFPSVAGFFTWAPQSTSSNVNLLAKYRDTPAVAVRSADQILYSLDGTVIHADGRTRPVLRGQKVQNGDPIHLVVGTEDMKIFPANAKDVLSRNRVKLPRQWTRVSAPDSISEILTFQQLCPFDPSECLGLRMEYGSRSSHLGFLAHDQVLGPTGRQKLANMADRTVASLNNSDYLQPGVRVDDDLVPHGVAVPIRVYQSWLALPENEKIRETLQVIQKEVEGLDPLLATAMDKNKLRMRLQNLRTEIFKSSLPRNLVQEIRGKLADLGVGTSSRQRMIAYGSYFQNRNGESMYSPVESVQVQSNVTAKCDHRSVVAAPDAAPLGLDCAFKAIYAGYWSFASVWERVKNKVDPGDVGPGVAFLIPPQGYRIQKVRAHSRLVTRIVGSKQVLGYQVSSVASHGDLVMPTNHQKQELVIAGFVSYQEPMSLSYLQWDDSRGRASRGIASPMVSQRDIQKMVKIAHHVELQYCRAQPQYYLEGRPQSFCSLVAGSTKKKQSLVLDLFVYQGPGGGTKIWTHDLKLASP